MPVCQPLFEKSAPPFFSVITASFNASATLPRLLDSLAGQTCRDFELLVQDGGSSDGALGIVESYGGRVPVFVCSEPDRGIYDAWNKALRRARGNWIIFLGCDDALDAPDTMEKCKEFLSGLPESILFCGGAVNVVSGSGEVVYNWCYQLENIEERIKLGMPFPYPGLWHKRQLFAEKSFDPGLRIAGDYDFVCRAWSKENGTAVLPFVVAVMRRGGISDSPQGVLRMRWENAVVASRYFSGVWTRRRIVEILKGGLVWGISKLFGSRASLLLDHIKRRRGLPAVWRGL